VRMTYARLFAVIATPVEVPTRVDRARWPVHVTLVGLFRVDVPLDEVAAHIAAATSDVPAFDVALGPAALFGAGEDIPVLLAEHPACHLLHESLAAGLAALAGFEPVEPAFWGSGYRPHATLGPAVAASPGEIVALDRVTLVSLEGRTGTPVYTTRLARR
jgi:2'-5' RNA ligase